MAKQETIADIIAERRAFEFITSGMRGFKKINKEYKDYTDRLDAAHKRELDELRKQVGNAAKLREALETLRELLGDLLRLGDAEYHDDFSNFCDIIDAALAEPPRNCDRFGGDIDKLREACARERGLNPEEDFPDVFPDWLLSTATKKEGGNDGNE